jgi:hypothetical protein
MPSERLRTQDLDPAFLSGYINTFISRRDIYPVQLGDGRYVAVKRALSAGIVAGHLRGTITLGAYALSPTGWSKWICFDADDTPRFKRIVSLARTLTAQDISTYIEPSRRGGHVWLFTPEIPGFQARRFGKQLLTEANIEGIELFPKQDRPITGPGSSVRLPLGIHRLTGRRYHFITPDGQPLALTIREQVALLAEPHRVPMSFVDAVLSRAPPPVVLSPTPRYPLLAPA